MIYKRIAIPAFILLALIQLYIPARMILNREKVLNEGSEYKFKAAPIDPTDPFRGKYITLDFEENTFEVENELDWTRDDDIYVCLYSDDDGFAGIKSVLKEKPEEGDFLKAKVSYITRNGDNKVTIGYPFNRYYMEESKAYEAEVMYRESQQDESKITYALVFIENGEFVLKDVLIDGVSIKDIIAKNQENEIN